MARIQEFVSDVFEETHERLLFSFREEVLDSNCTYNAQTLEDVLSERDIDTRLIRGVVVSHDEPAPENTAYDIQEYITEFGNGHWWVEAKLQNDVWWTIDFNSEHPNRYNQPMVMAGQPAEYVSIEVNPRRM